MKIVHRDELHRGGFAGLRETRMVMDPKAWGSRAEPGAQPGLGNFVYLADARFLPHGETKMHPHREIDVISVMLEGRIDHQGSLEHGQQLQPFDVQVQRAGGEGFSHNEVNPDDMENRMLQLWFLPETAGQPAAYRMYHPEPGERLRVYGGNDDQEATFPARTIMEVARMNPGDEIEHSSDTMVYIATGSVFSDGAEWKEGHLVSGSDFKYKTDRGAFVIIVSTED